MPGVDDLRGQPAVVDASVAIRWLVPEAASREAIAAYFQTTAWRAPRLLLSEVASGLRRKAAEGDISKDEALAGLAAVLDAVEDGVLKLSFDEAVVGSALLIALASGHKLHDCMYLALAEREGAYLVTADVKLAKVARFRGVPTVFLPSA